ncbi:MAG: tRNA (adenosine(37)-N6)-dimethylallyltransferase MiaA [Planctomycetes bacterium]|nr:tRNA (adenosine(37)-N6)-dimethylallyltransferase MiaA [Planctomycetota bacterium]
MKILILGVTASGKGRLSFDLASQINGEIVSIDSMKVYRRMDIGTAKPSPQQRKLAKYHLIDIVEPSDPFTVSIFLEKARETIEAIEDSGKNAVVSGGTAMYIKTLLYGLFEGPGSDEVIRGKLKKRIEDQGSQKLHEEMTRVDPEAGERIHPNDARRIVRALEVYEITGKPISSFQQQFSADDTKDDWIIIGLRREKEHASSRINMRVKKMVDDGLVEEVKNLLAEEKPLTKQAAAAIGYAEIIDHLNGDISLEEAIERIKINTRRFAKSQRTWFKTFKNVNWIDIAEDESPEQILEKALAIIQSQ